MTALTQNFKTLSFQIIAWLEMEELFFRRKRIRFDFKVYGLVFVLRFTRENE